MSTFWLGFRVANGLAIIFMLAVFGWAIFDIHNRLPLAQLSLIPPILMMVIRRMFMPKPGGHDVEPR